MQTSDGHTGNMMKNCTTSTLLAALLTATFSLAAGAAEPVPSATRAAASGMAAGSDVNKPVVGPRVGGSPADAEFRAAIQKSGAEFRAARTACRAKASEERRSCVEGARSTMQATRAAATTKHDAAVAEARAARK